MLVPTPREIELSPRLDRKFFAQNTLIVAKQLLGMTLIYKSKSKDTKVALIAETEAYIGVEDQAAHSRFGKTQRNSIMWEQAGHVYIFLIYGMHFCLNIVTESAGKPAAILIRGGILFDKNKTTQLTGPGKLSKALSITKKDHGQDVTTSNKLSIHDIGIRPSKILITPRVGIDYAGAWAAKPWRFLARFKEPELNYAPAVRADTPQVVQTQSRSRE